MEKPNSIRIDKWMWAVRLFKTRSIATDGCKGGKVKIENVSVKPSKEVKAGDIITFQNGIFTRTIKVKELTSNRLSAKLVLNFYEELTSKEEYEKLKLFHAAQALNRPRGLGRPTKKERRELDNWEWEE